jgi:hypothetical protein
MAILARDKAVFYNVPVVAVGAVTAASAGAMGADTNGVAIVTAATYGTRIEALIVNSDDTAAVNAFVYVLDGSTVIPLGIVNVPIQSGDLSNAPAIDAFAGSGTSLFGLPVNLQGKRFIDLMPGQVLKFSVKANMTAGKSIYFTAIGYNATTP